MFGFLLVDSIAKARITSELAILVNYPEAYDLIAVLDQLFNEPLNGIVGIVIVVGAAEEGPGPLGVLVVLVFGGYVEGVVGGIAVVEGVEGNPTFVFPDMMSVRRYLYANPEIPNSISCQGAKQVKSMPRSGCM